MLYGLDFAAPWVLAAVLAALFTAFAREWRPPEVTALAAAALLIALDILDVSDVLETLSNPAPITIAAMFIVSAAMVRTGVLQAFTQMILKRAEKRAMVAVGVLLVSIVAASAFMNNTPVVMMLMPVAVALAQRTERSPSKLLIPVSYAAILGGMCTLIGTSTNLLVDGLAREAGLAPFHLFEIAPVGLVAAGIGVAVLTVGQRFLPDRTTLAGLTGGARGSRFMVEAVIAHDSKLIGLRPDEAPELARENLSLVDVVRGDRSLRREMPDVTFELGDVLVLRTPMAEALSLKESGQLTIGQADDDLEPIAARTSAIVEALIAPGSPLLGRTLGALRWRRRYGVYPLALHRRGENVGRRLETTALEVGDTLLLEGGPEDLSKLAEDFELVSLAQPRERGFRRDKAPVAGAILAGVVIGAATGVMSIAGLAIIGAALALATRCIDAEEAFEAVDWRTLTLIVAMLAVGSALDKTGLVAIIVDALTPILSHAPPIVALALVYAMSSILTEGVTNNAVAVVMTPIVIALALALGCDPRPFVVAVMFAASASFMTPIGYQTNTLVYGAGGYRFTDFLRLGVPMNLICAAAALTIIPLLWPLQ